MSRKEYKKVYHGIPKASIDSNTVFYVDFDGTVIPKSGDYGNISIATNPTFVLGPTGLAYEQGGFTYNNTKIFMDEAINIDFIIYTDGILPSVNDMFLVLYDDITSRRTYISLWAANTEKGMIRINNESGVSFGYLPFINLSYIDKGYHHIRIIIYNDGTLSYHLNGMPIWIRSAGNINSKLVQNITMIQFVNYNRKNFNISDFHISNIDRGEYISNFPHDNYTSIIKPRMGQQQIKGDPMYSQVTELKVDTDPNDNMYKGGVDSSGFQRHTYKPELWLTSSNFENRTMIKIKGLNGEIISGVIDTDTALARITKTTNNFNSNDIVTHVDDISKLSINDIVLIYRPNYTIMGLTTGYTITSVDNENSTITLKGVGVNTKLYPGCFLVETTASSSSPLVKTQDGTIVLGTWSGLGTNEATFTLGENSNISGKDLYVTYALTMPSGNSDFPELPQDIDYINNENFIKLKETNKLTIEDDFMGKTKQYGDTCSSTAHYIVNNNSLVNPTTTLNTLNEIAIGDYYNISLLNMNNSINLKSSKENDVLQLICKFNLIDMVENKFSTELPGNKLQWIKTHITKISFYVVGRGNTTLYLSPYNVDQSEWFGLYGQISKYNGNNFSSILYEHSNVYPNDWISKTIDSNGNVYFCVYTDKVKPSTEFSIDIAYAKLEIELKYDSTFKLYFSENRRAREDICVPMLVQNETKTIKSYLDIKEPIVTEYKYNEFKGVSGTIPDFKDYVYSNLLQLNSLGTGSYLGAASMKYKASLANITQKPTHYYTNEPIVKDIYKLYTAEDLINYRSGIKYLSRGVTYNNDGYARLIVDSDSDANNFVNILPSIINIDGELRLLLLSAHFINKMHSTNEAIHFPIPNTPLLK